MPIFYLVVRRVEEYRELFRVEADDELEAVQKWQDDQAEMLVTNPTDYPRVKITEILEADEE